MTYINNEQVRELNNYCIGLLEDKGKLSLEQYYNEVDLDFIINNYEELYNDYIETVDADKKKYTYYDYLKDILTDYIISEF
nr:MAG TPA: hypothetical protein [Caudoviricetes sp.]